MTCVGAKAVTHSLNRYNWLKHTASESDRVNSSEAIDIMEWEH